MKNRKGGIVILLLGMAFAALAQSAEQSSPEVSPYAREEVQPRSMDRAVWEEAKNGMNFDRPIPKKSPDRKKNADIPSRNPEVFIQLIRVLVVVIALAALFFLIRSWMGAKTPFNTKVNGEEFSALELERIESDFLQMDLDRYIQDAIASEQYALAVRFYYLQVLKSLTLRGYIQWKREKTNRDFSRELRQTHLYDAFSGITRVFDQVRYGDSDVTRETFAQIETRMHAFLKLLPDA